MSAKLLVGDDWFEALTPNTIVDTTYESMLRERAHILFPGFVLVPFRYLLSNDAGNSQPQLALIDRHCRSWWLVLLQTGHAPVEPYYQRQADIVRSVEYTREVADLIASRSAGQLGVADVERLIKSEQPSIFVLLAHPPGPPQVLARHVIIGIAEIFKSPTDTHILRINGEQPRQPDERVGTLTRDRLMNPRLLSFFPRAGATFSPGAQCQIDLDGALGTWTVMNRGGSRLFIPGTNVSLPVDIDVFALFRGEGGLLRLTAHTS